MKLDTIFLLAYLLRLGFSFTPIYSSSSSSTELTPLINRSYFSLYSFKDENEGLEKEYAMLNNKRRTCILHFLTQRSFQSFMFLLYDLRDVHTSDWIERFLAANRLIEYHGTGAFNQTNFETWDQYFLDMMKLPKERIIIQARGRNSVSPHKTFRSSSFCHTQIRKLTFSSILSGTWWGIEE